MSHKLEKNCFADRFLVDHKKQLLCKILTKKIEGKPTTPTIPQTKEKQCQKPLPNIIHNIIQVTLNKQFGYPYLSSRNSQAQWGGSIKTALRPHTSCIVANIFTHSKVAKLSS